MTDTVGGALAAGAGVGLLLSIAAILFSWIPRSFAKGGPMLEVERMQLEQQVEQAKAQGQPPPETPVEYTPQQIRVEMNKEMIFLMPPMVLAGLWLVMCTRIFAVRDMWDIALGQAWMAGFLGSLLGALVGGFIVWLVRILGTLAFGREAMGMGDVHLMFAVGAVVGSGPVIVAFFLAPFFGIIVALYMLLVGKRREVPYGPYLSLATAFVLLAYHPIARYLRPGIEGMLFILQRIFAGLA
jgi:leader peptidase (prepilin peptidase)/N-methyltransferase